MKQPLQAISEELCVSVPRGGGAVPDQTSTRFQVSSKYDENVNARCGVMEARYICVDHVSVASSGHIVVPVDVWIFARPTLAGCLMICMALPAHTQNM